MDSEIMKKCTRRTQGQETREKLIKIGARLFALNGFNGVSMRALSKEAGTNLATVSYHFGGKSGFYEAILYAILERKNKIFPSEDSIRAKIELMKVGRLTGFEIISWFIKDFVKGLLDGTDNIWAVIIINRELAQPGEMYPILEEKFVKPSFVNINLMLEAILGEDADPVEINVISEALIGISLKFVHKKEFLSRIGEDSYSPELVEKVTDILSKRAAYMVGCREC